MFNPTILALMVAQGIIFFTSCLEEISTASNIKIYWLYHQKRSCFCNESLTRSQIYCELKCFYIFLHLYYCYQYYYYYRYFNYINTCMLLSPYYLNWVVPNPTLEHEQPTSTQALVDNPQQVLHRNSLYLAIRSMCFCIT